MYKKEQNMPSNSKEYMKAYNEANKDRIREQKKAYNEANKEQKKERNKEYYEANKEKRKAYNEANKEKLKQYRQTPQWIKSRTICDWKRRGLICDDYDGLYDRGLASTNCENCDVEYGVKGDGSGTFRCMDHDHTTGLFRNFLCNICNIKRR